MRDPFLESAESRDLEFWRSTFFDNDQALQCQFAAATLAFRGCNISKAFWTIGPGGVGQSMNSTLLANLFGKNHGYVDMNLFYTEGELRKQAAIMSDKVSS